MSGGNCVAGPARFLFWQHNQSRSFIAPCQRASEFLLDGKEKVTLPAVGWIRLLAQDPSADRGGGNVGQLKPGDILPLVPYRKVVDSSANLACRDVVRSADFEVQVGKIQSVVQGFVPALDNYRASTPALPAEPPPTVAFVRGSDLAIRCESKRPG